MSNLNGADTPEAPVPNPSASSSLSQGNVGLGYNNNSNAMAVTQEDLSVQLRRLQLSQLISNPPSQSPQSSTTVEDFFDDLSGAGAEGSDGMLEWCKVQPLFNTQTDGPLISHFAPDQKLTFEQLVAFLNEAGAIRAAATA